MKKIKRGNKTKIGYKTSLFQKIKEILFKNINNSGLSCVQLN